MQEPADASKSSPEKASCLQTDLQVGRQGGEKKKKRKEICQVTHSGDIQNSQATDLSTLCNTLQKPPSVSSEGGRSRTISSSETPVPLRALREGSDSRGTGQSGAGNGQSESCPLCPHCQLTTTSFALRKPAPARLGEHPQVRGSTFPVLVQPREHLSTASHQTQPRAGWIALPSRGWKFIRLWPTSGLLCCVKFIGTISPH